MARTLMDALRDLAKTGLTAEQQALVSEVVYLAAPTRAMTSTERVRKHREKMKRHETQIVSSEVENLNKNKPKKRISVSKEKVSHTLPKENTPQVYPSDIPSPPIQHPLDAEFVEFWKAYPRKEGKKHALLAYQRARKKVSAEILRGGLVKLLATGKERQYIPHAATWLNGERWLDEFDQPKPSAPPLDYSLKKQVRQNGTGWYVGKDTEEFEEWMRFALYLRDNKLIANLKYHHPLEAHVPSRWPPRKE